MPDIEVDDEVKKCVQIAKIEYRALGYLLDALEEMSYCARAGLAEEAITMAAVLMDHVADIAGQLIEEEMDEGGYLDDLVSAKEQGEKRVLHVTKLRKSREQI